MSPIRNIEYHLQENLGMNFGIYYTLLYQHVSDPMPGTRSNYGTGRLDVNLVWNLWEYPVEGHLDEAGMGHGLLGVLLRQLGDERLLRALDPRNLLAALVEDDLRHRVFAAGMQYPSCGIASWPPE